MLFRQRDHAAIERGTVTMTVRAWRRPQARTGGEYRLHDRGVIVVEEVAQLAPDELTDADAIACGYPNRGNLLRDLRASTRGRPAPEELTRIRFRYEPRIDERRQLAEDDALDGSDLTTLADRLAAMDRRSQRGPWTLETLRLIGERPRVVSTTLAAKLGRETRPFKVDVRKLKRLGLTISHEVGYELSPRGRALLAHLRDDEGAA